MECLIVIDLQKGFLNANNEHIVPLIQKLVENYQKGPIIVTKYLNNDKRIEELIDYHELKGQPETDLAFNLEKYASYIIEKNIYSAITEDMRKILLAENIDTAYIVGISTDCCVLKTVLDLVEMKIRPIVLTDYCAASKKIYHEEGLKLLKRLIGENNLKKEMEK